MKHLLHLSTVLVLNRNWQAIHVKTPADAFCMMASGSATGLDVQGDDHIIPVNSRKGDRLPHEVGLRLVKHPVVPRAVPATLLIRNPHDIRDWRHFLKR